MFREQKLFLEVDLRVNSYRLFTYFSREDQEWMWREMADEIRGKRKTKVNHINTEQYTFSHSAAYNKYFLNSLEYYAVVNVFDC